MKAPLFVAATLLAAGFVSSVAAQEASAPPAAAVPESLQDPMAKAAYAIGLNMGMVLRRDDAAVDPQIILRGLQDGLSGARPGLSPDQMQGALMLLRASSQQAHQEKLVRTAETNKTAGAAFLKANALRPGVVTLPDGLQYEILKAGIGPTPKADDTVLCNYRGTLVNGAEFDSSQAHGGPASFNVGGVINGWTEALKRMPVGSKWRLVVPADLAYGEKGAGPDIGPNAVLVFEVELVSIQPKA